MECQLPASDYSTRIHHLKSVGHYLMVGNFHSKPQKTVID